MSALASASTADDAAATESATDVDVHALAAAAATTAARTASTMASMSREQKRLALQENMRLRPRKVDKWGFAVDTFKASRNQSAKEREKEAERAEKWAPMIADWTAHWCVRVVSLLAELAHARRLWHNEQTKERFRKGLPDTLRGPLWRLITDSDALRDANPGLYARLSRQVRGGDRACVRVCVRVLASTASQESEQFSSQISRDIHRTFPEHVFFKDGGGVRARAWFHRVAFYVCVMCAQLGQLGLHRILNAYCAFDEPTGYTQVGDSCAFWRCPPRT
jgi:hypothetical protein